MKKKIISISLVLAILLMNACSGPTKTEPKEDTNEDVEVVEESPENDIKKEISYDFDPETNQKEYFYGIAYEVPSSWKKDENVSGNGTATYKIGNDALILTRENTHNYSESAIPYESDLINNLSSNFEGYSQLDRFESQICDGEITAINVVFSWEINDHNLSNHFIFFKHYDSLISFMLQSNDTSEYDRSEDFNDIINSIHKWSAETDSSYTLPEHTTGQINAANTARDYLNTMAFSYTGLIEQLKYEGYSDEDATYAADNCGADWNEQAAKKAQEYIDTMSFSRSGLIEQLQYEGFTAEQAEYGVSSVGY